MQRVSNKTQGERECYVPQKAVIREATQTTIIGVVFDESARVNQGGPSLNDYLETGPPLQNLLWSVLIWNHLKPVALCEDIKQAFLQVWIREADCDAIQFHWIRDKDSLQVKTLRFKWALFSHVQLAFLLAWTLKL